MSSPAWTASSTASRASSPSRSPIRRRTSMLNSGPMAAPRTSARPVSLPRWPILRAITARTPVGTATRSEVRSPTSNRRPSADSNRTASPTNNGFPLVSRQTAATRRSCGSMFAVAPMNFPTASAGRPPRVISRVARSRAISEIAAVSGWSGVSSISRYVPTTRIALSLIWLARNRSSRIEAVSTAWRSSRMTTSGASRPTFRRRVAVESKSWKRADSDAASAGVERSGKISCSSGRSWATSLAPAPTWRLMTSGAVVRR